MKTRRVLSVVLAFVMLVIISGCSSETAMKINNEDEVTESTKSNTVITEITTAATEATTVLSTKDGITLEDAPRLEENTGEGQAVEYMDFDVLEVNLTQDGASLTGMYFSGTIDGVKYSGKTLAEEKIFRQALSEKYPDFEYPSFEEIPTGTYTSNYALKIKGLDSMSLIIDKPLGDQPGFFGTLELDLCDVNNAYILANYSNMKLTASGPVSNSALQGFCYSPNMAEINFNNFNNCYAYLVMDMDQYSIGWKGSNYALNITGGEKNYVYLELNNMNENTNVDKEGVTITTGGMLANNLSIKSTNSSVTLIEDPENPNFNSEIICKLPDPYYGGEDLIAFQNKLAEDITNGTLNYNFQTNDLDNTPVRFVIPGLGVDAVIQTDASMEKITRDFLLNAPSDGSVYNLV
jgi:hypothetical protein